MTLKQTIANNLRRLASALSPTTLATITSQVDDTSGWQRMGDAPNDRDAAEMQQLYTDALTAWRKNPMAKRIVDIITDYCLGDGLTPTSTGQTAAFIEKWWNHPKNRMPIRMPDLVDELTRAGDLFLTLHTNPDDGLSYIRPIPKDRIIRIETLPNDWETEIAYYEAQTTTEPRRWLSPFHPDATDAPAIMLHYRVNRVVGALLGESDLATLVPWLLRYSRMLEDRVRLHWATKAFLWMVTVPTNLVKSKHEQYNQPPASGTVIVKDQQEEWEAVTPNLHAFDARYDLHAVRMMIDSAGFPPHWRGEPTDVNLATAIAMERSATRHLRRRQLYIRYMVVDLTFNAHLRAYAAGRSRSKPTRQAIKVDAPDLNRQDNKDLAIAARALSGAMQTLSAETPARSPTLLRRIIELVFRFAGETLDPAEVDTILAELESNPPPKEIDNE
ncbi:hypothetical protein ACFLWA_09535 [Chloroflexota bacterium]